MSRKLIARLGKVKVTKMNGSFDLSQVLQQANQVSAESGESSGGREKLIYPQNGKLKVRILFNPKSQVVIRKFERHTVNGTKVPCMSNYGQDCPICKVLSDIKNAKGTDITMLHGHDATKNTRALIIHVLNS